MGQMGWTPATTSGGMLKESREYLPTRRRISKQLQIWLMWYRRPITTPPDTCIHVGRPPKQEWHLTVFQRHASPYARTGQGEAYRWRSGELTIAIRYSTEITNLGIEFNSWPALDLADPKTTSEIFEIRIKHSGIRRKFTTNLKLGMILISKKLAMRFGALTLRSVNIIWQQNVDSREEQKLIASVNSPIYPNCILIRRLYCQI